ncbi:VOC family protein [Novosphingobium sp.]|uniref:VOC family protein n=1 Tax=Novosphingobium sp. TaxID=1874826 RepID=UPI0038B72D37
MAALSFAFAKLIVGDLSALEEFYTGALGFVVTTRIAVDAGDAPLRELFFALPGKVKADFALIEYLGKPVPVAGEVLLSFMVADLEASIAAVVAHGGRDLSGVIEAPDWQMRLAFVADPGGHRIELMQGTGDRDRD